MTALTRSARDTIKWHWADDATGKCTTIAGYTRYNFGDGPWRGDSCGCTDDRCIGYHHDEHEDCHCIEVCLDTYVAAELVTSWWVLDVSGTPDRPVEWMVLAEGEHRDVGRWVAHPDADAAATNWRAQGWTVEVVERTRDQVPTS